MKHKVYDYNDILVKSYRIYFTRDDGHNTEGLHIPYEITGQLGRIIDVNASETIAITAIRHQAKLEPPLVDLAHSTDLIYATLHLELYGEDMVGRDVFVETSIEIQFADFAG